MEPTPKYRIDIQELGETGDGGATQWKATPVVRINAEVGFTTERLPPVHASTEEEASELASAAAERWIHARMAGEA